MNDPEEAVLFIKFCLNQDSKIEVCINLNCVLLLVFRVMIVAYVSCRSLCNENGSTLIQTKFSCYFVSAYGRRLSKY
jgi:hypothetical protein